MADAAKKPPGPMKFVLFGCGILAGVSVLGLGSCAGIMVFVYNGTAPIAKVGATFLHEAPELKKELGDGFVVKRNAMGWNVSVNGDSGNASITYTVTMANGQPVGEAVVHLLKRSGNWEATSARLRRHAGDDITVGKQPSGLHHKRGD